MLSLASMMAKSQSDKDFAYFSLLVIDFSLDMSIIPRMADLKKYRRAVLEGLGELTKLTQKRRAIDDQIGKLVQLLAANVNMLPKDEQAIFTTRINAATPASGLSDAILRVLDAEEYMSTLAVREELITNGYDLSGHVNALASIHTTLKRLFEAGKIDGKQTPDGKMFYRSVQKRIEKMDAKK
jgi:hypothetical protein